MFRSRDRIARTSAAQQDCNEWIDIDRVDEPILIHTCVRDHAMVSAASHGTAVGRGVEQAAVTVATTILITAAPRDGFIEFDASRAGPLSPGFGRERPFPSFRAHTVDAGAGS